MNKIIIIVGLPGSGKTTYIKENFEMNNNVLVCDDYHASSADFKTSKYYNEIVNALKHKKDVIISDIIYCKKDRLDYIMNELKLLIKELKIKAELEIIYFENNIEACKKNVLKRSRENRIERELSFIDNVSKEYEIPPEVKIIKIKTD